MDYACQRNIRFSIKNGKKADVSVWVIADQGKDDITLFPLNGKKQKIRQI